MSGNFVVALRVRGFMGLRRRRWFLVGLLTLTVAAPLLLSRVVGRASPGATAIVNRPDATAEQLVVPDFHLDEVPGFGRSESAVQRDDTIALYESWQEERHVARCMRAAGFTYRPEALYAENADFRSALLLGVEVAPGKPRGRSAPTAQDADSDPAARRRRERICGRRASGDAPRVWKLRHDLDDELLEAQTTHALQSATFRSARAPFDECVTRHLGHLVPHIRDLEVALLSAEDADAAEECFALWERAAAPAVEQSLGVFVARHHDRLAAQIDRYEGAIEDIAADRAFARWLRRELQP